MGKYFEIPKNELILLHCKYDSIIIYNIIIIDLPEINQSKAGEGEERWKAEEGHKTGSRKGLKELCQSDH
jgi:hypothetical protein